MCMNSQFVIFPALLIRIVINIKDTLVGFRNILSRSIRNKISTFVLSVLL